MADEPASEHGSDPGGPHGVFQSFQHTPVGARVPEKIGRGAFSTAVMILQTNEICVLDFLAMMTQPQQVVARIIMTVASFSQFLAALRLNIGHYEKQIGPLAQRAVPAAAGGPPGESHAAMPPPGGAMPGSSGPGSTGPAGRQGEEGSPTPITELYERLKFPEELLGGVFANAVMIRHTPEEFCFDFIGNLFPRPVVASRVYMAAGRIRSLLDTMAGSLERHQRSGGGPPPAPPPESL
ncbi:MAG: DUF3467 domain-containing protein [Thermoguttaceae bacterium]|jgi:hypothetical protein